MKKATDPKNSPDLVSRPSNEEIETDLTKPGSNERGTGNKPKSLPTDGPFSEEQAKGENKLGNSGYED